MILCPLKLIISQIHSNNIKNIKNVNKYYKNYHLNQINNHNQFNVHPKLIHLIMKQLKIILLIKMNGVQQLLLIKIVHVQYLVVIIKQNNLEINSSLKSTSKQCIHFSFHEKIELVYIRRLRWIYLIWSSNNNNQWNCSQIIQAHNKSIQCLILNNNEDLFISSSSDNTIKFWVKQMIGSVNKLSQIIRIGFINQVQMIKKIKLFLVEEISQYQYLNTLEKIKSGLLFKIFKLNVKDIAYALCNLMHVYEMNDISKQFTKIKDIVVNQCNSNSQSGLFAQQFMKQKQLLVSKHGNSINLIRKTDDNQFKVEQSIQFDSRCIYGQMSDDAEYLITWDHKSKQIQIRKYTEK
ncbi:unnamed protein product (macronuclear) [Paramecium tetraurelia]|uniref:Uncharacterized protein n=1 Tax=Paramecium tetraurelia TaxID=5888 RepID=A0CY78_PARTE|nr:uncharacterized protein GSPATT00039083001 [Paramecium tetraurelia]CAK75745.1 unnamed protein product [Paramecium tetraurelia]|eukprot:XP_001443142.1 hypothetical protein (macronuclear) [Paramecium tetraurelia strain d4-2]